LSTSEASLGSRPGLSNAVDIVVAPNAAFSRLRQVPTWGWAFLIASVLGIIGALMITPAMIHAMDTSLPAKLAASPQFAKLPADQQQSVIAAQLKVSHVFLQLGPLFVPVTLLVVGLLQGVVMTIANAIGRGDGSFAKYFALSITVSIVGYALATLVLGPIVMLRGASSFETQSAITGALPSLGLLAPGAKGFLAGFLGGITVFYVWGAVLLALGMQRVGRIPAGVAWSAAVLMLLLTAALAGWGAAING
jgi:Yip1 domain